MLNLKVDITNSKDIYEALAKVAESLALNEYNKNSKWIVNSQDAFIDSFRSLDTESEIYKNSGNPKKVHIDLYGVGEAKQSMFKEESEKFSPMDYFLDILDDASENKERSDGVDFSYKIIS